MNETMDEWFLLDFLMVTNIDLFTNLAERRRKDDGKNGPKTMQQRIKKLSLKLTPKRRKIKRSEKERKQIKFGKKEMNVAEGKLNGNR